MLAFDHADRNGCSSRFSSWGCYCDFCGRQVTGKLSGSAGGAAEEARKKGATLVPGSQKSDPMFWACKTCSQAKADTPKFFRSVTIDQFGNPFPPGVARTLAPPTRHEDLSVQRLGDWS